MGNSKSKEKGRAEVLDLNDSNKEIKLILLG